MVSTLPTLGLKRLEGFQGKRIAHNLAQSLERIDVAKCDRLDQYVAGGRSLGRASDHVTLGGIGGKLVEERVLTTTTNDV